MKRILITGGSGFIGTHLIDDLSRHGFQCFNLDIKAPAAPSAAKHFLEDVRNTKRLSEIIRDECIDLVVHFAAIVSVPVCENEPTTSTSVNLIGTESVCEAVRITSYTNGQIGKVIPIVFASSAACYGRLGDNGIAVHESMSLDSFEGFYAFQKYSSEKLLEQYARRFQIPSISFRFFNVYGKGQDPTSPYSGVITRFKRFLEDKKPITVFGDGSQTRDFISVRDIVMAIRLGIQSKWSPAKALVMNLGTGRSTTVKELGSLMMDMAGSRLPFDHHPHRIGDIKHSLADTGKAEIHLGFRAQIRLENGLKDLF